MPIRKRLVVASACLVVLAVSGAAPGAALFTASSATSVVQPHGTRGVPVAGALARPRATPGPLSAPQLAAMHGPLPQDPVAYASAKARADSLAPGRAAPNAPSSTSQQPATLRTWQGIDPTLTPSDSHGAIGSDRYVEIVNAQYAIYDRTDNAPLAQGTINSMAGASASDSVFDPQVIWDPTTARFYYSMVDVASSTSNVLAVGYSKTSTPAGPADWCHTFIDYGAETPDYPKIGDSVNLVVIGVNVFPLAGAPRSDITALFKPPAGTGCVAMSGATQKDVRNADNSVAWTPMPANDVEGNASNYTLANRSDGANFISVFQVVNYGGILFLGPRTVSVPAYSMPADVPQPAPAPHPLDTLDGRFWTAVEVIDPARGPNALALWTAHTVFGGAGAQVRWYEIKPEATPPVLYQSGVQTSTSVFVFNDAIAPDRRVLGNDRRYGDSMVLGFNTGSSTQPVDVEMIAKSGANAPSAPVVVKTSTGPISDGACNDAEHPGVCRWGDYSGASPDPASDAGQAHGVVWFTNSFAANTHSHSWNWSARPK
ncbi:MAG: hypothetical protein JOZ99_09930 [Actinobacteria bacterium]|nr:hypothetical protein [Actinomycetota bacterium]